MANSVGRLYNATLGDSQFLSDGEHTLFTTNSSTTQIIKELKISPQAGLSLAGGYLEVNGHNVSSLNATGATLSGELIVPPNSTVKLKLPSSYPVAYSKEYEMCVSNSPYYLYVNTQIRNQATGAITQTLTENKSLSPTSNGNVHQYIDIVDARGFAIRPPGNQNSVYQPFYFMSAIYHDNNSVQKINMHAAKDYGEYQTSGYPMLIETKHSANYKGFAFDRDITRSMHTFTGSGGNQAVLNTIDIDGNIFKVRGSLNTRENTAVNFTKWNSVANSSQATANGAFSPQPTSSYPRGHCIGDWYFWIPQNSYSSHMYGVSLKTGQMFQWASLGSWQSTGNNDFTVSIDSENDKFVFWRPDGTTTMRRNITTDTITELEAITSGGVYNATADQITVSLPSTRTNSTMASCQLSDRLDGGFGFKDTNGHFIACDIGANLLYSQTTFEGIDNFAPYSNGIWKRTIGKMTAAEAVAAGIPQPTFDISIFGYTAS